MDKEKPLTKEQKVFGLLIMLIIFNVMLATFNINQHSSASTDNTRAKVTAKQEVSTTALRARKGAKANTSHTASAKLPSNKSSAYAHKYHDAVVKVNKQQKELNKQQKELPLKLAHLLAWREKLNHQRRVFAQAGDYHTAAEISIQIEYVDKQTTYIQERLKNQVYK